jgi:hypothetical protein
METEDASGNKKKSFNICILIPVLAMYMMLNFSTVFRKLVKLTSGTRSFGAALFVTSWLARAAFSYCRTCGQQELAFTAKVRGRG